MDTVVVNQLGSLHLELEHTPDHELYISPDVLESFASEVIVLNGDRATGLEQFHYIEVISPYAGELSIGQSELYTLLLTLQSASVYCTMTIDRLAKTLDTGVMATMERLANLKSLGAIIGTIPK